MDNTITEATFLGKVFLITGPPASGKTTLTKALENRITPLTRLSFGQLLYGYFKRADPTFTYERLRLESADLITPDTIRIVEGNFISNLGTLRREVNVVYDSHPVTRESYGMRVTPFNAEQLKQIQFDAIISLECSAELLVNRVNSDSQGRGQLTNAVAENLLRWQAGIAVAYSVACSCPVFVLDASLNKEKLLDVAIKSLMSVGMEASLKTV